MPQRGGHKAACGGWGKQGVMSTLVIGMPLEPVRFYGDPAVHLMGAQALLDEEAAPRVLPRLGNLHCEAKYFRPV